MAEPDSKRAKVEDQVQQDPKAARNGRCDASSSPDKPGRNLTSFSGFRVKRVLAEDAERKRICLEGSFDRRSSKGEDEDDVVQRGSQEERALVILEKAPFSARAVVEENGQWDDAALRLQFANDVYSMYDCSLPAAFNLTKANVIWPATEKHLEKYVVSPTFVVKETPGLYAALTVPFLEQEQLTLDWVYNILDHEKEADRIVYEDTDPDSGFVLLPDFKWSGNQVEDLYCLAIVRKRGIKSIRDLTAKHLPLLRKLATDAPLALKKKYGVPRSQLRIYFHYQPSYYHLHVHYSHMNYSAPGINVGKAHFLDDVIRNLTCQPNFYSRATIPFYLKKNSNMFSFFNSAGYDFDGNLQSEESVESSQKMIHFCHLLGKAKHEQWTAASYGDSAWRMGLMALCLPTSLNRKYILKVALASALASLGKENDWDQKLEEVRTLLLSHLPLDKAARLFDLFARHVAAKRGDHHVSEDDRVYSQLIELEANMLALEELQKDELKEAASAKKKSVLNVMCNIGFPGSERYSIYGETSELESLLEFFSKASALMHLKRTGWVRAGIRQPEKVSGHMFRMGVMAIILEDEEAEADNRILGGSAVVLSVVHDLAECIVGDMTPSDPVTPEQKHRLEMDAMRALVKDLPCSAHSRELLNAFERYEDQPEGDHQARLTKDLDKFDMVLQAAQYERKYSNAMAKSDGQQEEAIIMSLQDFFDSTSGVFEHPAIKRWDVQLREMRKANQD